ncbi:hypothetical protein Trydic_g5106 [Trypoxylus dichotomus]
MNVSNINIFVVLSSLTCSSLCILQKVQRDPVNLLWGLTNFAIQSRQGDQNIYNLLNYPATQSILGTLHLISRNDDHYCVPKLLCELISGGGTIYNSGRQESFLPTFDIDMDSLSGLLSAFEGPNTSPILLFGKAALLGYMSKDDSQKCTYAYPRCPKNPDVLLNYLNNHNGGFFRFFNGVKPNYFGQNLNYPYNQISHGKISFPNIRGFNYPYIKRGKSSLIFPDFDETNRDKSIFPIEYSDRTGTGELIIDSSKFF